MPQRKCAKKELKKSLKRKAYNLNFKRKISLTIKKFKKAILAKDINNAQTALKETYKILDKAASKNVITKKKASREKSKLAKLLNTIKS